MQQESQGKRSSPQKRAAGIITHFFTFYPCLSVINTLYPFCIELVQDIKLHLITSLPQKYATIKLHLFTRLNYLYYWFHLLSFMHCNAMIELKYSCARTNIFYSCRA